MGYNDGMGSSFDSWCNTRDHSELYHLRNLRDKMTAQIEARDEMINHLLGLRMNDTSKQWRLRYNELQQAITDADEAAKGE
jgi:hypothetical protein